jgi:hypothetical protein
MKLDHTGKVLSDMPTPWMYRDNLRQRIILLAMNKRWVHVETDTPLIIFPSGDEDSYTDNRKSQGIKLWLF